MATICKQVLVATHMDAVLVHNFTVVIADRVEVVFDLQHLSLEFFITNERDVLCLFGEGIVNVENFLASCLEE